MNYKEFTKEINRQAAYYVLSEFYHAQPERLGFESRVGKVYISADAMAIHINNRRNLEFYGEFEYIDEEHKTRVGDYIFYSGESERVRACLERFKNVEL